MSNCQAKCQTQDARTPCKNSVEKKKKKKKARQGKRRSVANDTDTTETGNDVGSDDEWVTLPLRQPTLPLHLFYPHHNKHLRDAWTCALGAKRSIQTGPSKVLRGMMHEQIIANIPAKLARQPEGNAETVTLAPVCAGSVALL